MKKVRLIPDDQRILVLPDEKQDKRTSSGIILPGSTQEEVPLMGTIVEAGKGDADNHMRYTVGQRVLFSNYAGVEVTLDYIGIGRKEFRVMNQMDVMGILIEVEE